MNPLSRICLYDDPSAEGLDVHQIAEYVRGLLPGAIVEVRDDLPYHFSPENPADVEKARVWDLEWPGAPSEELQDLRSADEDLGGPKLDGGAALYDGVILRRLFAERITPDERTEDVLHIAFVDQILGSFETDVFGFKLRVVQPGPVALISTTGIIEAPERPEEYYFVLTNLLSLGNPTEEDLDDLDDEFHAICLCYGDSRLTEALKGYVLQAIAHHLTGKGTCDDPDCRLFEAETHEALLHAQCTPCAGICGRCVTRLGLAQDTSEAN